MLALAVAARARGHEVRFVAPDNFTGWIGRHGFACAPNGIDIEAVLRSPGTDLQDLRWQHRHLVGTMIPRLFESVTRAAADVDIVVGAGVQVAGGSAAERSHVPYVSAAFCPCAIPGSAAPPPFLREQRLPGWVNRMLWRSAWPIVERVLRPPIDRARAAVGLAPAADLTALLSGVATIVAADRDLAPVSADAPSRVRVTDAWIFDETWPPDPTVEAFLRAGPAPVYVGFGSMVAPGVRDLPSRLVAASRLARCRLLVAGGWTALDRDLAGAADVLALPAVDHAAVLPHVAAALHHGGAGTTTAAARAGVPQIIAPHILDQFYWARRIEILGLGPRSVPIERLTAAALARRLVAVAAEPRFRARAHALGPEVSARNGAGAAVRIIEDIASH